MLSFYLSVDDIVVPPLREPLKLIQMDSGPLAAQNLDKNAASGNIDSYVWFALELYWTRICGHQFDNPVDEVDPRDLRFLHVNDLPENLRPLPPTGFDGSNYPYAGYEWMYNYLL